MKTILEAQEADLNLRSLGMNKYPGRGIVIGRSETHFFQLYFVMGRSQTSRNRILVNDADRVFTELADPDKHQGDKSLIIYNAMRTSGHSDQDQRWHIVSNGVQTDDVYQHVSSASVNFPTLSRALRSQRYEPDKPNFTPRITGVIRLPRAIAGELQFELSILRHNSHSGLCDREFYQYEDIPANFGRMITTYAGDSEDGGPLPSFSQKPLLMPIFFDPAQTISRYWEALNKENRVSIALKWIDMKEGGVHIFLQNAYEAVPVGTD